MRRAWLLGFLLILGCGAPPEKGERDSRDDSPTELKSARFGTIYLTNALLPDGFSVVLGESELSCEAMEAPTPGEPLVIIQVHLGEVGECEIVNSAFDDEKDGCIASARIVWPREGGKKGRVVDAIPGRGRVVLQKLGGASIEGEYELAFPKGLANARCEVEGGFASDDPDAVDLVTHCTCTNAEGKTWTCSEEGVGPPTCCSEGLESVRLAGSFAASTCLELCGCTTEDTYCPCGIACAAPSPDCTAACESAADLCSDCLPGAECADLEARCMEGCETSLMEPLAAAILGCFEGAASCEEFDDCVEQRCE